MKVYRSYEELPCGTIHTAVTFGNFDGVHLGHQRVLSQLLDVANQHNVIPALVTFDPHPLTVIAPERVPRSLLILEERLSFLRHYGAQIVVVLPFDQQLAQCSAEEFVKSILVDGLGARVVLLGPDARFGAGRRGDASLLNTLGASYGFINVGIASLELYGETISSSRIRRLVSAGEVEHAARLLGRPHRVPGKVVEGDKRGRMIGFPTANVAPPPQVLIPAHGVYAGMLEFDGQRHLCAVNVGVRPTFEDHRATIEAHVLDFSKDLYGSNVVVEFIYRIRGERKFSSVEALVAQIANDCAKVRRLFTENPP
ncbi:MAG: bifunctional riboflavin kinase/FAD synthetase [Myxococcales bacterium]|nr:bifunctional riboflavin kinase/FAD synthetase [Myxococcales bacterium]